MTQVTQHLALCSQVATQVLPGRSSMKLRGGRSRQASLEEAVAMAHSSQSRGGAHEEGTGWPTSMSESVCECDYDWFCGVPEKGHFPGLALWPPPSDL